MKENKYYSFSNTITATLLFCILQVGLIAIVLSDINTYWYFIFLFLFNIYISYYAVKTGYFQPIYISADGVKYKDRLYEWKNLYITLYPSLHRSLQYGYYIMFDDKYLDVCEIKSKIKKGFYIYLRTMPLKNIIENYNKKILILDTSGDEGEINSTKQINLAIKTHNNKYCD